MHENDNVAIIRLTLRGINSGTAMNANMPYMTFLVRDMVCLGGGRVAGGGGGRMKDPEYGRRSNSTLQNQSQIHYQKHRIPLSVAPVDGVFNCGFDFDFNLTFALLASRTWTSHH